MSKKKEVKSIFGAKKLQKIVQDPPPDKRDYLDEFVEAPKDVPFEEEEGAGAHAPEDGLKVYKSYYASTEAHDTFRDIVHTLRHKVDADLNNGEVFSMMLEHFKKHVIDAHGALLAARPPKKGRR